MIYPDIDRDEQNKVKYKVYPCFTFTILHLQLVELTIYKFSRFIYELSSINQIVWSLTDPVIGEFPTLSSTLSKCRSICIITHKWVRVLLFVAKFLPQRRSLWKKPQRSLGITGLKVGLARNTQKCLLSSLGQGLLLNFHANQRLKSLAFQLATLLAKRVLSYNSEL